MDRRPIYISNYIYELMPELLVKKLAFEKVIDSLEFWVGTRNITHPRLGTCKTWNFFIEDHRKMPSLDYDSPLTFSEVTLLRVVQIRDAAKKSNRKIGVLWSGGIDSTVIVAALIKYLTKDELQMVTIFCNNASYFENPYFYDSVIKEYNLTVVHTDVVNDTDMNLLLDEYIITDGEPGDKIWPVMHGMNYAARFGKGSLNQNIFSCKDNLITYFESKIGLEFAHRLYDLTIDNIVETSAPVETVSKMFWWYHFNFLWVSHPLYYYSDTYKNRSPEIYNKYCTYYMPWYDTIEYQQWSFSSRTLSSLCPGDLYKLKLEAKQFIYEIDKNPFYLQYKSKVYGTTRRNYDPNKDAALIVFNGGTVMHHDDPEGVQRFIEEYCLVA